MAPYNGVPLADQLLPLRHVRIVVVLVRFLPQPVVDAVGCQRVPVFPFVGRVNQDREAELAALLPERSSRGSSALRRVS